MALDAVLFVSKRLQPIVAALICLAFVQFAVASCTPEPLPMGAWRVPITR
jgi:hypothetical protein